MDNAAAAVLTRQPFGLGAKARPLCVTDLAEATSIGCGLRLDWPRLDTQRTRKKIVNTFSGFRSLATQRPIQPKARPNCEN